MPNTACKDLVSVFLKMNKFHPLKEHFIHKLRQEDLDRRFEFCCDIQTTLGEKPFMTRNIFLSDEAKVSSNGTVTTAVSGMIRILIFQSKLGTSTHSKQTCGVEFIKI